MNAITSFAITLFLILMTIGVFHVFVLDDRKTRLKNIMLKMLNEKYKAKLENFKCKECNHTQAEIKLIPTYIPVYYFKCQGCNAISNKGVF